MSEKNGSTSRINQNSKKHRLKQRDLVMNIFFFFEEEYENKEVDSIWDIELPIERIRDYLSKKCSVNYRSNLWVYTQLRRYEEELGVKLFRKLPSHPGSNGFKLAIHRDMVKFYQKQHLYVSKKIKVANGVYDKIRHDFESMAKQRSNEVSRGLRILLGAGSTIYHLANIIAEKSWEDDIHYTIYTHNLGSLKRLLEPTVNYRNVEVCTPAGKIDPVTYTIFGNDNPLYENVLFDYIIMGTSYVYDGRLYVESKKETEIKRHLLACKARNRILILTKHEFTDRKPENPKAFGRLTDYDYIVVPHINISTGIKKRYDSIFDSYNRFFQPEIIHWNYSILKTIKD